MEMNRQLTEKLGIPWRGRPGFDWDWYVNPGFLPAYTPTQREAIIDEVFAAFATHFGYYPQVAGSWLLDAHSMAYMSEQYHVKAFCICREQYAVDAYTLWGGYYSGGYYPSKNNMLCPASRAENTISTPVFRMLGIDPIYGYDEQINHAGFEQGCCTMEPVWSSGNNSDVLDWYFRQYFENPCVCFSHCTTGQENSFGWEKMKKGYADFDPTVGSEQGGVRPLLIIQNDVGNKYSPTTVVVPITSKVGKKSHQPTHVPVQCEGLSMNSMALLEQIRTLDKSRLKSRVEELDAETMKRIETALLISVGVKEERHGG